MPKPYTVTFRINEQLLGFRHSIRPIHLIYLCLQEVVSEIVTSSDQLLKDNSGDDDGELIPVVPVGAKLFKDVEHTALVSL